MKPPYIQQRQPMLSAGINLDDLAAALTDPRKRFEFPIKPFQIDLAPGTKVVIIASVAILSGALIYLANRK